MAKKSFILHLDSLGILQDMPDDFAGKFLKAIYQHQLTGELPEMDFALKMAVMPFIKQFARDEVKYNNTILRNQNNGKNGGRPKGSGKRGETQKTHNNPVGFSETQHNPTEPKKADSDNDSVNDNDSVSDLDAHAFRSVDLNDGLHPIVLSPNRPNGAPSVEDVTRCFDFLKAPQHMRKFFEHYESSGWLDGMGRSILMNWDSKASKWVSKEIEAEQRAAAKAEEAERKKAEKLAAKVTPSRPSAPTAEDILRKRHPERYANQ